MTFITSLSAAFVFGTISFWILAAIYSLIALYSVKEDQFGFLSFLSVLLVLGFFLVSPTISWPAVLIFSFVYILIGGAWSVFKWWKYVKNCIEKYKKKIIEINSSSRTGENLENNLKYAKNDLENEITVNYYKNDIVCWIAFWPYSAFWDLSGNLISSLYDSLTNCYKNISNRALKNLAGEP